MNIQGGRRKGKWEELIHDNQLSGLNTLCVTETHLKEDERIPEQTGWIWEGVNRGKKEKKGGGIGFINKEDTGSDICKRCKEHNKDFWGRDINRTGILSNRKRNRNLEQRHYGMHTKGHN